MKQPSFFVRFLIVFIPLLFFLFLMSLAGITDNVLVTVILLLAIVWMIQAIYKKVISGNQDDDTEK